MNYQTDTRRLRREGVRVGRDDTEVAVFGRGGSLFDHLVGEFEGVDYRMKLPAPWTGFRYRLLAGKEDLASAKRRRRMHAFDPDRPLIRHSRFELELDAAGRALQLIPEDRHGLTYVIFEGEQRLGASSQRTYADQQDGPWEADLEVPDDWPAPLVAFIAWLAREGRDAMSS